LELIATEGSTWQATQAAPQTLHCKRACLRHSASQRLQTSRGPATIWRTSARGPGPYRLPSCEPSQPGRPGVGRASSYKRRLHPSQDQQPSVKHATIWLIVCCPTLS